MWQVRTGSGAGKGARVFGVKIKSGGGLRWRKYSIRFMARQATGVKIGQGWGGGAGPGWGRVGQGRVSMGLGRVGSGWGRAGQSWGRAGQSSVEVVVRDEAGRAG